MSTPLPNHVGCKPRTVAISSMHVSFWCMFLDKDLTKHHSNIEVSILRDETHRRCLPSMFVDISKDVCQYMHASHGQLTYVTREVPYGTGIICKSTIMVDWHISLNDTCWLPRTHILVVCGHKLVSTNSRTRKPWCITHLNNPMVGEDGLSCIGATVLWIF